MVGREGWGAVFWVKTLKTLKVPAAGPGWFLPSPSPPLLSPFPSPPHVSGREGRGGAPPADYISHHPPRRPHALSGKGGGEGEGGRQPGAPQRMRSAPRGRGGAGAP